MDRLVRGEKLAAQLDIGRCFNFLRGAEHTFPQLFRAMDDIVNFVGGRAVCNYQAFAQQLQNYFFKNECRFLDEYGIPFPIASKMELSEFQTSRELIDDLSRETSPSRRRLSALEQKIVARGLGL